MASAGCCKCNRKMVQQAPDITLVIAFAAGFLSFVSPCVLPLVPSYLIYITGLTLEELTSQTDRSRVRVTIVLNSLFFILGLTAVFIAFGASASLIGQVLITYQDFIRKAGGALIVVFGLYVMGVLKLNFLMTEKRSEERRVGKECRYGWGREWWREEGA